MKKLIVLFGFISLAFISCNENKTQKMSETSAVSTQSNSDQLVAEMTFDHTVFDFGDIQQYQPQETVFTFKNTGNAPLIITNATSSCGCTVPEYPKNTPIAPGETGEMIVRFNGSGMNKITKTIRIQANTLKGEEMIQINANILPKAMPVK